MITNPFRCPITRLQVRIIGPAESAVWTGPVARSAWTRHYAPLRESDWTLSAGGSWANLLQNVTELRVLIEEMDQLGKQLGTVERTYNSAYSKLATGRGNLARQAEQFRELGATVKKTIDRELMEKDALLELEPQDPNGSGREIPPD